ncbi:hypothetical protein M2103_000502 [Ereboglobus sp. PH5-5]|uniref:hypothetical protein n=1 Tax=Ereboglobus sp. PH5-5 TaxID=2940529 RepID=UPI002404EDAA|nr:hypothetical protein [Ereboglobus sp. PH5-5]MDF9832292.1 hypothetical protein [Ereboglobus sp. PH5-5]
MPFIAGNLGGGTLANKVANQIEETRAASELADAEDAAPPYARENAGDYATATDAGNYDDDIPPWLDAEAEQAYLADQAAAASAMSSANSGEDPEEQDASGLPSLESLKARIPAETLEVLETLFRAKFTTVRKIPKKLLK